MLEVDLTALPAKARESQLERLSAREAARPFQLDIDPLLRCRLLRSGDTRHALILTLHHIVGDAWSLEVLVRELSTLYAAFVDGQPSPLEDLPVQFADYAAWQQVQLSGEELARELSYWRGILETAPRRLELPTDRPRPETQKHLGARHPLAVGPEVTEKLKQLGRSQGATLFMTLTAAVVTLLHHHSRQRDLVVGTNVANRDQPGTEGLIGCFINQVVLRADLAGDPSFLELLKRIRRVCLEAFDHQHLPFEKLVEVLRPERDASRSLLYQAKVDLQRSGEPIRLPGLRLSPLPVEQVLARYDVHFYLVDRGGEIQGSLLYNAELFYPETARRLVAHLIEILGAVAEEPTLSISELCRRLEESDTRQGAALEGELEKSLATGLRRLRPRGNRGP